MRQDRCVANSRDSLELRAASLRISRRYYHYNIVPKLCQDIFCAGIRILCFLAGIKGRGRGVVGIRFLEAPTRKSKSYIFKSRLYYYKSYSVFRNFFNNFFARFSCSSAQSLHHFASSSNPFDSRSSAASRSSSAMSSKPI